MSLVLKESTFDGIIFDVDGCLYPQSTLKDIFSDVQDQIAMRLCAIANLGVEEAIVSQAKANYLAVAKKYGFRQAFVYLGGTRQEFDSTFDSVDRSKHLSYDPVLKGMLEILGMQLRLGILTSAPESTNQTTCAKLLGHDWRDLFEAVVCSDTPGVSAEKPHEQAFVEACQRLGTKIPRTVMVGDQDSDLVSPAKLGMMTVQVGLTTFPADLSIPSIHDLLENIEPNY